jgi:diguanylate cyclase (GGDEF)-like protein
MTNNEIEIKLRIKKLNPYLVTLISLFFVIFFGILDLILGYEISFSIFYLIPISISVFLGNFKTGTITSVLSAIMWYLADILSGHKYTSFVIPFWNAVMRLGYFLLHSFYLNKILIFNQKLQLQSSIDSLTGVYNTNFFIELFSREIEKSRRTNKPITIAYIDLDNFKQVNDTYGHLAGDNLLKKVAQIIKNTIRPFDIFARIGGDEFVLVLPETDFNNSEVVIERIRKNLEEEMLKNNYAITLSIGVITYTKFINTIEEMIQRADTLMYEVKQSGKNNFKHIKLN